MGRKNCAVIMLTSACLVLTACAPTEFPEQNGTEHQNQMEGVAKQELTEFDTDDVEKIPDHLTCQVDDLLMVDADVRLWGLRNGSFPTGMRQKKIIQNQKKRHMS